MKKEKNPTLSARGSRRSLLSLAVSMALLAGLVTAASGAAVANTRNSALKSDKDVGKARAFSAEDAKRTHQNIDLASDELRQAVARLSSGKNAGPGVDVQGKKINVEILHEMRREQAKDIVKGLNGEVLGSVGHELVQALVPYGRLVALEAKDGISYVRPPLLANVPEGEVDGESAIEAHDTNATNGEEVLKTNADAWHAIGESGAGVRVGIVDYFGGSLWDASVAAGELKPASGTFCQWQGTPCDVWAQDEAHGVGVGEIIYELAPDTQLYVATAGSAADLQAAVNYFHSQGVTIITRSLTAQYDGPGDGTGPIATVIDDAVNKGIAWFNSAGNNSGVAGVSEGSYFRSTWNDTDADGWMNFADGSEGMIFGCRFMNGLRWSDWGANRTDYDAYIYDDYFSFIWGDPAIAVGGADQAAGAPPLEHPDGTGYTCDGQDVLAIHAYAPGSGTSGDILEFMVNGSGVEFWQNNYSANGPASDPFNPGAMSIGAIDPPMGTSIADYSSWGPTNDGRIKPDFSAAACVYSYVYAPNCFNGTSSATPVAAGVGALLKGAGVVSTPAELKTWLLTNAMTERGATGLDNVFGAGELILPDPPTKVANYRPDGHIKLSGFSSAWKGNDVYTMGAGQMWKTSGKRGTMKIFDIRVQNDGDTVDSFAIIGTKRAGFRTQYLRGKINITSAVLNGTYATPNLAPGKTHKITMKVKPGKRVKPGKTYAFKVHAISYGALAAGQNVKDVVGVKYVVKR